MKHFLLSIFASLLCVPRAHAIDFGKYCAPLGVCQGGGEAFFIVIAQRATIIILSVIGVVCVLVIIYGAFRIMTSAINEQGRDEGKKAIITALIGLALAIMAGAIVQFVGDFIGANFF